MKNLITLFVLLQITFNYGQNYTKTKLKANVFDNLVSPKTVVCKIKKGKEVELLEYGGEFWKIKYKKNCIGWVATVFLEQSNYIIEYEKHLIEVAKKRTDSIEKNERLLRILKKREANSLRIVQQKQLAEKRSKEKEANRKRDSLYAIEKELERQLEKKELRSKCHYLIDEIDEFTGEKKLITRSYKIKKYSVYEDSFVEIRIVKHGKEKYVFFYLPEDLGCVSPYETSGRSYTSVKLENDDIIKFNHVGEIDCSSEEFKVASVLTNNIINRLKKSPIKILRFSGTERYFDIENIEYTEFFIDKLKCLDK